MNRILANLAAGLLMSLAAQAATTNTKLTVEADATVNLTTLAVTATGPATLEGIGSGTFSGSLSLTAVIGAPTVSAPFTITLSGGTLTGTLIMPASILTGSVTSGTGSATITKGTGAYEGATGTFPTVTGTSSGSFDTGLHLSFSGPGTIDIPGGGGPQNPVPTITSVLDAGSYTANIAQGSIFVVKGSNLSAEGYNKFDYPLPTTSGGVKITFTPTAGGSGTDAYLFYTYNLSGTNQLAALLPSSLPAGNYKVTVTAGGATSAPFSATVVQRKAGLITQDGSGTGLAVIQNYITATLADINRLTTGTIAGVTISPAKPGQVLVAWATGMGPVTGSEDTASPGVNLTNGATFRVLVGGLSIVPDYVGRTAGLAGTDQINFTLPANVPTGCSVPFQVTVNGIPSNLTTISIAPNASSDACVQSGYTTQQLRDFDNGKTFTSGVFFLSQLSQSVPNFGTIKINSAGGQFTKVTGFQLGSSSQLSYAPSSDCQVFRSVSTGTDPGGSGSVINLDAGAVTLTGPPGSNIANLVLTRDLVSNAYSATLATEGIPALPGGNTGIIVAGKYTLSGAGGKDVAKFDASLTLGAPISITLPTIINRSAGLKLNWTGGNSSDIVQISGSASATTGSGANATVDTTSFSCTTTAGPGTFTVPASILQQLPQVTASASGGGFLSVVSTPNPTSGNGKGNFTANLTSGQPIDFGYFVGLVGANAIVSYQ